MLISKEKISIRQLVLLYITIVSSPAIRLFPTAAAKNGHQMGWVSPIIGVIPIIISIFVLRSFYKVYKDHSFSEIIYNIFGKIPGKIVIFFYTMYVIFLAALYLRYLNERLVGTVYTMVNDIVFTVSILAVLAFVLKNGLTVIARMNEIIVVVILLVLALTVILLLPTVRYDFIQPVITEEWKGIFTGSLTSIAIYSYITLLFFLGHHVNDKEKIVKHGLKGIIISGVLSTAICIVCIGNLGFRIVAKMPLPYSVAVKLITFMDIIEKMESAVVAVWIFSDFVLVGIMALLCISLVKSLCNLKHETSILNIMLILIGLSSYVIAVDRFEMEKLSNKFLVPANIILFYIIPLIMLGIGKLRKKI